MPANLSHSYDANGNVTFIDDAVNGSSFDRSMGYDDLDRLTSASGLWGSGSYSYDSLGNLTNKTEGGQAMNYNYDSQQRLTSITGANAMTFSYDAYGNVTGNGAQSFTYNRAGNMISSTSPSVTYAYDGHKRRVQRTEVGQLLHKQAGGVSTDYIYAGQMLVATKSGSTVNYVHTDLLGSPIDGKVGSTSYTVNYSPWGEKLTNPVQLAGDVGYTGHQADVATGLRYMQARYYDPVVGRFMAVDPVGFTFEHPASFNRYAYASNNPVEYIDPDGRCGVVGFVVGAVIDAAVQYSTTGTIDPKGVLIAGAVGAVTGGVGGNMAKAALLGRTIAQAAVRTTAATGGIANAAGTAVESLANGETPDATEVAVSGVLGALGGGAGARMGNSIASNLDDMASRGGVSQLVSETTRSSYQTGGDIVDATSSLGTKTGQVVVDTAMNYIDEKY